MRPPEDWKMVSRFSAPHRLAIATFMAGDCSQIKVTMTVIRDATRRLALMRIAPARDTVSQTNART
jgi:hypothetical protein